MSFLDDLKKARTSPTSVLHEFWTNYDPNQFRLYVFVEGNEDLVFYKALLAKQIESKRRLFAYRCDGKQRVYETFRNITARLPACRDILFFVDKDVDDIIGKPWPTDPRIFVTDVYSVENYVVTRDALARFIEDFVEFRKVTFDPRVILDQFESELNRFHRLVTPIMAYIIYAKRQGMPANFGDVNLRELYAFSVECCVRIKPGERLAYLNRAMGISISRNVFIRVREVARELRRLPPKRFVRGKFELWFLVEFIKHLCSHLETVAGEIGGIARMRNSMEHHNAIAILVSRIETPPALTSFLCLHLSSDRSGPAPRFGLLRRSLDFLRNLIGPKS